MMTPEEAAAKRGQLIGEGYGNTQTGPLYRSPDRDRSWTPVPVEMPDCPHRNSCRARHQRRLPPVDETLFRPEYPGVLCRQVPYFSHSAESLKPWKKNV